MQCIRMYAGGFQARVSDNFISHASTAVPKKPSQHDNWITYHIRQICVRLQIKKITTGPKVIVTLMHSFPRTAKSQRNPHGDLVYRHAVRRESVGGKSLGRALYGAETKLPSGVSLRYFYWQSKQSSRRGSIKIMGFSTLANIAFLQSSLVLNLFCFPKHHNRTLTILSETLVCLTKIIFA